MRHPSCNHKCFPCPSILHGCCRITERLLFRSLCTLYTGASVRVHVSRRHSRGLFSRRDRCRAPRSLGPSETPSIRADKCSAVSVRAINIPSAGRSASVAFALSQCPTLRSSPLIRKSSALLPPFAKRKREALAFRLFRCSFPRSPGK